LTETNRVGKRKKGDVHVKRPQKMALTKTKHRPQLSVGRQPQPKCKKKRVGRGVTAGTVGGAKRENNREFFVNGGKNLKPPGGRMKRTERGK